MLKNIILLFPLFLLCINKAFAQPNCTAKILNVKDGRMDACFLRSPNPIGNITKYTILLSGIEIYEVEFTYYKEGDSIKIKFYDKQNSIVKSECVRLKPEDSHFLICDFKPNIKQINNDKNYQILFGIDNPNQQFITLYQFQAIGGIQSQFILQDVPPNIIYDHSKAVLDYEKIIAIREAHDNNVARLKREMTGYKDSIINNILENENALKLKEATLVADKSLQIDFTKKMDDTFLNYFRNIYSFKDEEFEVNFSFSCDGYGKIKIDTIKTLNFKSGPQKNWVKDSFMLNIEPLIEKKVFNTLSKTYSNQSVKADFMNWFEKKFSSFSNLGEDDLDSFTLIKKIINNELDPYISRTISIPTIYHYTFKYLSSVKRPIWKYVKERDGNEKFIDKSDKVNRVEITENLKQKFDSKYGSLGTGKYNLEISTLSLNNDNFQGQDIQLIEIK